MDELDNKKKVQEEADGEEKKVELVTETVMSTKKDLDHYKNHGLFCTELKHLYVCITRPKKRLIIFDSDD